MQTSKNITNVDVQYDITFFIPTYNEEKNIAATIDTIIQSVTGSGKTFEILIFDDASTDETLSVIAGCVQRYTDVHISAYKNKENKGLGYNYFRGSFFAKGEHYMLVNGDNVEPAESIRSIIDLAGSYDMVIPYFGGNDRRTKKRQMLSTIFTKIINILSGNRINYYNGPVLHVRDNVRFWRSESVGYGYQAEMICRLLCEGMTYIHVEVENTDRQWGTSKAFSLANIFSVANSAFHIFWRRLEYAVFKLLKPGVSCTSSGMGELVVFNVEGLDSHE